MEYIVYSHQNLNNFQMMNLNFNNSFNKKENVSNSVNTSIAKKRKIRNKFTQEEDQKLRELVRIHGDRSWSTIASLMKTRSQRQCRERWKHYLSCDTDELKNSWTKEEDEIILNKFNELGAKWTKIARELPGRSDLQVKNRFLKHLSHNDKIESDEIIETFITDDENKKDEYLLDTNFSANQQNTSDEINMQLNPVDTESLFHSIISDNLDFNSQLGFNLTNSNLITEFCQDNFFNQSFQPDIWSFE